MPWPKIWYQQGFWDEKTGSGLRSYQYSSWVSLQCNVFTTNNNKSQFNASIMTSNWKLRSKSGCVQVLILPNAAPSFKPYIVVLKRNLGNFKWFFVLFLLRPLHCSARILQNFRNSRSELNFLTQKPCQYKIGKSKTSFIRILCLAVMFFDDFWREDIAL